MKFDRLKIYILILILLLIILRIYSEIEKRRKVFSQSRVSIPYQISESNNKCGFSTDEFFFTIPRCKDLVRGDGVILIGTLDRTTDNTLYNKKRLIIEEISKNNERNNSFKYWLEQYFVIRGYIWEKITHPILILLPHRSASVFLSMVLGRKEYLDEEVSRIFQDTGTTHLQVISGYNFTVLFAGLYQAVKNRAEKWVQAIFTLGVATVFVLLVGFSPSVIRAYLSLIAIVVSRFSLFRQYKASYFLIIVTLFLLFIHPAWIFDLSFQLTILATVGVVFISPVLLSHTSWLIQLEEGKNEGLYQISPIVTEGLVVGISALVPVLPILISTFRTVNLIGIVVTAVLGWLVSLITSVGFWVGFFAFFMYHYLPQELVQLILTISIYLPTELFFTFLKIASSIPYLTFSFTEVKWYWWVGWYGLLLLVVLISVCKKQKKLILEEEITLL